MSDRLLRRRMVRGLRGRVALTFGVGAFLVSGALASSTFLISREYLYDQRERTVVRQAALDAVYVADQIDNADADVPDVLASAGPPGSGALLLELNGQWYSSALDSGPQDVPAQLRARVRTGVPARTTVVQDGYSTVVVGLPLRSPAADFYRIVPLREMRETLRVLQIVLGAGAIVATLGGIALGVAASRRLLQPLNLIAATAAQIAGGELDSRLPPTDDPDLATIVGSFNSMVDTLRQRIERDGRFAADVSHELRSPLTTLVAATDVLQRRQDELAPRARAALDLVVAELDRFRGLLESLLTLARAEALDPAALTAVDVADVVGKALHRAGLPSDLLVREAGVSLVLADEALLERAFFNIVDNAQRHGGGLTAVLAERSRGSLHVAFDDAGPGVIAAERERVFERFATSRAARGSSSGSGIGLALVAETVRAHRGAVWCAERDGPGARFVVSLPLADGAGGDDDR
ncbi:MAG: ATP-binding protein [Sporichthyaceae bacterium]